MFSVICGANPLPPYTCPPPRCHCRRAFLLCLVHYSNWCLIFLPALRFLLVFAGAPFELGGLPNWCLILLPALHLLLVLAGAPFIFGAVLMLVAIGIAWTIDGVSGQRLMLQHQQQNLHLDGNVTPLGDIDEEAGG